MFAHLRIDEHDRFVGAELNGGAGRFADGRLKYQASGVIDIAAHQVEASGGARSEDWTVGLKAHFASSSTVEQRYSIASGVRRGWIGRLTYWSESASATGHSPGP